MLYLAAGASAQIPSPTGNLYGRALDAQGNSLIGVTVTLTGPGAALRATTDANGDFRFLSLSPSEYFVMLEHTGFETTRRDVTVALGDAVLSLVMRVAGIEETVTVTSGAAGLDNREIETGATYGRKELESIPTTRDPWAVLRQVPGVLVDQMNVGGVNPGQSSVTGKGAPPEQTSYNIDGVAISLGGVLPIFVDFDSLTNIEVTTGGSDLSIATPGVTVNLVTRRGTNQFMASARGFYIGDTGWDYGVEAGGPLWKDRFWLWGAFAHNDFPGTTRFNFAGEPVETQQTFEHWNVKLNAQLAPSNALTLSSTHFERSFLGFMFRSEQSAESIWKNGRPGLSVRLEDSQVLSSRLFASFYLAYVTATSTHTPVGGVDEQADQDQEGIWRHSNTTRQVVDDQRQAGLNASAFLDTGNLQHELKIGAGYRRARLDTMSTWPGDLLVGYGREDEASITRRQDVATLVNLYDVFLGDTIKAGNLTLNVGARLDNQQGKNLPSAVPANPIFPELLPAVQYPGDSGYPITWRMVQPRIGATYGLGVGRTLLRASYARFADQLDSGGVISLNAFPDIAELVYPWNDANGNGRVEPAEIDFSEPPGHNWVDPEDPASFAQINQISETLEPPMTDEIIVGVERQIASELWGSLAYTYRSIRNLEFAPLIGTTRASYRYFGNATGTAVDEETRFVLNFDEPYYGLMECPDPCEGHLIQNRPDARQTYSGVELQLLKSLSHGWMARVSFAYNDWQQQIGPGAIVDPNDEAPGTNASGGYAGALNAHWQFNVSGMVVLPLGIAASANVFGRQGFPTPYSVEVLTNDPYLTVPHIQIGQPTRYRTPNVYEVDLQLSRVFPIGSSITVTPQFACFNLLDSRTVLTREGSVGSYDAAREPAFEPSCCFNGVTEELGPRAFRGGVRVSF